MEQLKAFLPYLILGFFMFVMMSRGGCCGGHSKSNRSESDNSGKEKKSCH